MMGPNVTAENGDGYGLWQIEFENEIEVV